MRRYGHNHIGDNCAICAIDRMGLRVTKQRQILLELLIEQDQPVSAEQIHMILKNRALDINLSTVYRILDQYASSGLVQKTQLRDEDRAFYIMTPSEHSHHLICTGCKRVITIAGCPLDGYGKRLEQLYGYVVSGHKLEIYGLCPDCQGK